MLGPLLIKHQIPVAFQVVEITWLYLLKASAILIVITVIIYLITGIRVARNKLQFSRKLNRRLRDEIRDLVKINAIKTSSLELAIQNAEESNRLKSLFLANMSHEVRTPLNGIVGFSELIIDDEIDSESKLLFAEQITKNSQNLLRLIDQIFHLSVIETGKVRINKENFNIADFLMTFKNRTEDKIEKSGREISLDINIINSSFEINTDKEKLQLILNNLLDNALKYTESGHIKLSCDRIGNDYLFKITDTGCGLDENEFEKIFDPFVQGFETVKNVKGGSGLGLSNVKNYVILLGGKIWCEKNTPNGAVFNFTLPAPSFDTSIHFGIFQNQLSKN